MSGKPNTLWLDTMVNKLGSREEVKIHMQAIGSKGGSKTNTKPKGFAYARANGLTWHVEAGRKGGKISKRSKK